MRATAISTGFGTAGAPFPARRGVTIRPLMVAAPTTTPPAGTVRDALRQLWREAGSPWSRVPRHQQPRHVAIARAFLETDEPATVLGARYGLTRVRVSVIAHTVVYNTLGLRTPR